MKATLLNGALPGDSFVDAAGAALQDTLQAEGWTVTPWFLREQKIAYCLGCFECWTKTGAPVPDRRLRPQRSSRASSAATLLSYLTPITFGGFCRSRKKAIDRSIGLISPSSCVSSMAQ